MTLSNTPSPTSNTHFMRQALALARARLGQTWPNPSVGCIIVKDNQIIGQASTARGGRPHAETQALAEAGAAAKGSTLYVTMEPCAHYGQTPPCVEAIIAAGVAEVVIACRDEDPRTHGESIERLKQAHIRVKEGVMEHEAQQLQVGFFSRFALRRPYITLKLATSADGFMAHASGHAERWITGEEARMHGHTLRAENDVILTGIGTVLADDPLLTCRAPGMEERSPVRVVLDSNLRIPLESRLVKTAKDTTLWVIYTEAEQARKEALADAGVQLCQGNTKIADLLKLLIEQGVTRVLVEAGPRLTEAFLASHFVDEVFWYHTTQALGDGGAMAAPLAILKDNAQYTRLQTQNLANDSVEHYRACSPASLPT